MSLETRGSRWTCLWIERGSNCIHAWSISTSGRGSFLANVANGACPTRAWECRETPEGLDLDVATSDSIDFGFILWDLVDIYMYNRLAAILRPAPIFHSTLSPHCLRDVSCVHTCHTAEPHAPKP